MEHWHISNALISKIVPNMTLTTIGYDIPTSNRYVFHIPLLLVRFLCPNRWICRFLIYLRATNFVLYIEVQRSKKSVFGTVWAALFSSSVLMIVPALLSFLKLSINYIFCKRRLLHWNGSDEMMSEITFQFFAIFIFNLMLQMSRIHEFTKVWQLSSIRAKSRGRVWSWALIVIWNGHLRRDVQR